MGLNGELKYWIIPVCQENINAVDKLDNVVVNSFW